MMMVGPPTSTTAHVFIKRYTHQKGAVYPDHGVSLETFAIDFMLELESLSPLVLLQPDDEVRHIEEWELLQGVDTPSNDEGELEAWVNGHGIG